MKKFINKLLDNWQVILFLLICMVITAVFILIGINGNSNELAAKKEEAKYGAAYDAGYEDGICDAQEHFKDYVIWDLSCDIEDEYGMSPDEAIIILSNYAEGEPTPKQELYKAINTLSRYYYDLHEAINDIDNYFD